MSLRDLQLLKKENLFLTNGLPKITPADGKQPQLISVVSSVSTDNLH